MESLEMRFLRSVKGCTRLERVKSNDVRQESGVRPITEITWLYKESWGEGICPWIDSKAVSYQTVGKRSVGRPWIRRGEAVIGRSATRRRRRRRFNGKFSNKCLPFHVFYQYFVLHDVILETSYVKRYSVLSMFASTCAEGSIHEATNLFFWIFHN